MEYAQASLEFSLDFHSGENKNCLQRSSAWLPATETEEQCMEAAICLIVSTGFLETLDKEVPPDRGGKITLLFFTIIT